MAQQALAADLGHEQQLSTAEARTSDKAAGKPDVGIKQEKQGNDNDEEAATRLKALGGEIRDQDDVEKEIGRQADELLLKQANERDEKRLEKAKADKDKLASQIRKSEAKSGNLPRTTTGLRMQAEIFNYEAQIKNLDMDIEQIQQRMDERLQGLEACGNQEQSGTGRLPNESQRDFLIRTGKITPFSKMPGRSLKKSASTLQEVLLDAEEDVDIADVEEEFVDVRGPTDELLSHRNLLQPGFFDDSGSEVGLGDVVDAPDRPKKRRRLETGARLPAIAPMGKQPDVGDDVSSNDIGDMTFTPDVDDDSVAVEDHEDEAEDSDEEDYGLDRPALRKRKGKRKAPSRAVEAEQEDLSKLDDGSEKLYQARLKSWVARRSTARRHAKARRGSVEQATEGQSNGQIPMEEQDADTEEWHLPHPTREDAELEEGFRMPGDIYPSLFDYQKTGVRWLWELYSQQVGGIIGDEMGLGKTIQIIAFLAGLHYSKKITRPIIIVVPATLLSQWVKEFHTWWPPFRVSILHTSGSGMINVGREAQREDDLLAQTYTARRGKPMKKTFKAAKKIVDRITNDGHVLVTTYAGLQSHAELLIPIDWEYAVLDEGHKIRNPNAAITIYCKELRTANRIILSGTPMQNNLVELWSLFDFIFPMRLGTLVNFRNQFEIPIKQGGYANASNLQVQTAARCAETLKDAISPYLLQRFKIDVAADLPKKTEQVLFCKLTKPQRQAYEEFLESDDMKSITNGKRNTLYGVDILRKICNHPDLQDHKTLSFKPGYNYGSAAKSGKMIIVKELLDVWKKGGHKTLLFAQHRIMIDILEKYVKALDSVNYLRMDGATPIHTRQDLVNEFNNNPNIHVFLLTTKVGGLGVNLTGADRVIIYDPDWNPSTDIQARERAWRLGQKREVQIFRLMVAGTIEEKVFHRQIFKQFLTNKILKDPKQRQTFQFKDLHDLFTLGEANGQDTETSRIFKGTEVKFTNEDANATRKLEKSATNPKLVGHPQDANDDQALRDLAGVASIQAYDQDEDQPSNGNNTTNSEARLMEGIFARSGVHSALEHDQIINGKLVPTADPKIIEKEAKKVAAQAASELRRAGELARQVPIGTPTWTGEFGSAGRPEPRPSLSSSRPRGRLSSRGGRGGPSSSSILSNLQSRQTPTNGTNSTSSPLNSNRSTPTPTPSRDTGPRGIDFMKLIRDYLIAHEGKVHTQMLIDHFNRFCGTPARTMEFKEMLRELAVLQKGMGSRGRGAWVLKDEYK
ncbi:MAG: hypothetical protein MMC33_000842 [Icmadophila ericetorum]|nr:hypothetical protein [Icmadophila ericetorum]